MTGGSDQGPAPQAAAGEAAPSAGADSSAVERPRFRLGNRPPLTGVRGPVIIAVLVFHSNFRYLPGAWASPQFFFVLSGFLITSLLVGEGARTGRISLKTFYARRATRLLPPLLLTVTLLAVYGAVVHVAEASQRLWGEILAATFYYEDYRYAVHPPFLGFLAQSWSLSVEEQFYVVWSLLMVVAVTAGSRRLAYVFAVGGLVVSILDRVLIVVGAPHFSGHVFNRVYYAFDTRADALFVGCLLGLLASDGYFTTWKPAAVRALVIAALTSTGLLAWLLLYQPLQTESLTLWWLPLSALSAAVIIVYFVVCPDGFGSRLLGTGVFVFLGDLSYTLYLVHFPVYLAVGTPWGYWPSFVVKLAIIFAIAVPSWFFIEKPLMQWRRRVAARTSGGQLPATST